MQLTNGKDDRTCRRRRHVAWPNRLSWIIGILAVSVVVHGFLLLILPASNSNPLLPVTEILLSLQEAAVPPEQPEVIETTADVAREPLQIPIEPAAPRPELEQPAAAVGDLVGQEAEPAAPGNIGEAATSPLPPVITTTAESLPEPAGISSPEPVPVPAPDPAPVTPEIDLTALLGEYAGGIKAQVLRHKRYPRAAERLHHEGAVKVGFRLAADGGLLGVTVKSPSGYDELDAAAVAAVNAAAPFDAIPAELQRDSLSLSITLEFRLE